MQILIASSIDPIAIEKMREDHDIVCAFNASEKELQEKIKDREVLIFRSGVQITASVMEAAPQLALIIRAGSGVDNIDSDYVNSHNIEFHRIPEPSAKAVAEMTFGMMLALVRNILVADRLLRKGKWAKNELKGYLLTGKTLGIVGAGNIGSRVGQLGAAWGMNCVGCVEPPPPEGTAEYLLEKGIRLTDFDEVVSTADFLSIHVPLKESTRHLINAETFKKMKKGSYLINLARGGVVDEKALYDALTKYKILMGAALDVHEKEGEGVISPFVELPNVVLTPHIGAQTYDTQTEIGERILKIIQNYYQTHLVSSVTVDIKN